MITKETDYIKSKLVPLSRSDKLALLSTSSLTDKEIELLTKRFVHGCSLKECSDYYSLEVNTVSKNQQKAVKKLYHFLVNN